MNWRKWKLGLLVASLMALFSAGAGLVGDMGWKSFLAVFCVSLVTNWGTFLKAHPVEDIQDTGFIEKNK